MTCAVIGILLVPVFLAGCFDRYARTQRHRDWDKRVRRGCSAVWQVEDLKSLGRPDLTTEQLIHVIRLKPDFEITPVQFMELFADQDSFRDRCMSLVWMAYCRNKMKLEYEECSARRNDWESFEAFKSSSLWVYDESVHFEKPLHSEEFLYCLFCGEAYFVTHVFLVDDGLVIGCKNLVHELAFENDGNE
jgi:hypothetical protein